MAVRVVTVSSVHAIGWSILGYALFSVSDAMTKILTALYPVPQIVFLNVIFSLIPIVCFGLTRGGPAGLRTAQPGVHVLRAALGLGAIVFNTMVFNRLPLADAYALLFTGPLVIAGLSAAFLGEHVDRGGWGAILVGFAAVLYMIRPSGHWGDMTGLLAAFAGLGCYAASALVIRRFGRDETLFSFPFYGNLFAIVALAPLVLPHFDPLTAAHLARSVATGIVLGLAQTIVMGTFQMVPPPVVAPFQYSQILWGALLGFIVFGDIPEMRVLIGGGVVVAAGIHLMRREAARAVESRLRIP